jgi:hypothetical protein
VCDVVAHDSEMNFCTDSLQFAQSASINYLAIKMPIAKTAPVKIFEFLLRK